MIPKQVQKVALWILIVAYQQVFKFIFQISITASHFQSAYHSFQASIPNWRFNSECILNWQSQQGTRFPWGWGSLWRVIGSQNGSITTTLGLRPWAVLVNASFGSDNGCERSNKIYGRYSVCHIHSCGRFQSFISLLLKGPWFCLSL